MMVRWFVPRHALAAAVAVTLGGCGGGSLSLDNLSPSEWFSGSSPSSSSGSSAATGKDVGFTVSRGTDEARAQRGITPGDLVGADGQCQDAPSGSPPRGVILTMTECELVGAAGIPEQVNIGAGEGGVRRAVLTYTKGENAGIYTFVSGRLKIIERAPEPAKPERRRRGPTRQRA